MINGSSVMGWSLIEAGMDGLNVNVIAWVIVNGTTRGNQLMNSFIVFHQALSDGTDKKISQQQIFSTLESNNLIYRMWKVPCFNLLFSINKIRSITLIFISAEFDLNKLRKACWSLKLSLTRSLKVGLRNRLSKLGSFSSLLSCYISKPWLNVWSHCTSRRLDWSLIGLAKLNI